MEIGRAVADEHCAFDRCANLAVFDPVGLGALEHIFPRRDVNLAAAEVHSIEAVLDRSDDFLGVVVAGEHVSLRHARHRHVCVRFTPAIAGGPHVHEPRILPLLHVADQDAVLDQYCAVRGRAFVVDRQRTAARLDGAIIDNGDSLGRDLLTHEPGESRGLFAIEVAFKTVSDRFMQHNAGPARAEHDIHFTGWSRDSLKIDQRLPYRFVDRALPGRWVDRPLKTFAPAKPVAARFLPVTVPGDHRNVEANHRANVAISLAICTQDLDHLPTGSDAGGYLSHARILLTRVR